MQERAYNKRGEQYLLIKSPPASGKSRALMFIALDKLQNQKLKQAIIVVPEKSIGSSFHDEPLSTYGFWADWKVEPRWNLCDSPGTEDGGKVEALIDLRPLIAEINNPDPDAVANGIAYDAAHDRLFVTGKYWPTLFEIKLGDEVGRAR